MSPSPNLIPSRSRRDRLEPARTRVAAQPCLRFTPTAWAKLLFLRDSGDSEVGGFAVTSTRDLLLVEQVQLIRQQCSHVFVSFDDEAVADYFDRQVDSGLKPEQFARVWVHTHPGNCALPSSTDEETFQRVFGRSEWAVMFILAQEGQTYARLRFSVGPGADAEIPVQVEYGQEFAGSNWPAWQEEYQANVRLLPPSSFAEQLNWWDDEFLPGGSRWHEELLPADEVPLDAPF
jgi:hypothetical protein